jgi:16S rRNA (uracil1498-N3)-methyltransferase
MRALFYPDISAEKILLSGDEAHHFIKVLRLEIDEDILLLDGKGTIASARVSSVTKKEMTLSVDSKKFISSNNKIHLAIGIVKKEALEEILKASVEMGLRKLYLIRTQFSQPIFEWTERYQKLLIGALEQSNNPYLPEIQILSSLKELPLTEYTNIYTFSSQKSHTKENNFSLDKSLVLIGPEGGFSTDEENFLIEKKSQLINLPLPILRAKTATILAVGYLLGKSPN